MFTVVIPVYNHERYIVDAILSSLRSRFVDEVLLVDDGSRDSSPHIISAIASNHPKVRDLTIRDEGNCGAHVRLNQLVEAATNEWVAVLNSDDMFVASRFDFLALPASRCEAEFFFGDIHIIDSTGKVVGTKHAFYDPEFPFPAEIRPDRNRFPDWQPLLFNQNFIATTSNMVFTKSLHRRIGGFADYRYCHDWDFALRATLLGSCRYLPYPLTMYRVHEANTIGEDDSAVRIETKMMFNKIMIEYPYLNDNTNYRIALDKSPYVSTSSIAQ
jgi:glycosyltransferase involved in cell wall biosynthesis